MEEKSTRGIEEIEAAKVKLLKWWDPLLHVKRNGDKDKGKEEPENKGSAAGQVLQGSAAAPKK